MLAHTKLCLGLVDFAVLAATIALGSHSQTGYTRYHMVTKEAGMVPHQSNSLATVGLLGLLDLRWHQNLPQPHT
jgi:hypothetical protein